MLFWAIIACLSLSYWPSVWHYSFTHWFWEFLCTIGWSEGSHSDSPKCSTLSEGTVFCERAARDAGPCIGGIWLSGAAVSPHLASHERLENIVMKLGNCDSVQYVRPKDFDLWPQRFLSSTSHHTSLSSGPSAIGEWHDSPFYCPHPNVSQFFLEESLVFWRKRNKIDATITTAVWPFKIGIET